MSITHEAYLNIVPGDSPAPIIKVSQYDADFSIVFHLIAKKRGIVPAYPRTVQNDEDVTINIATSATVSVRGTKTDGNGYSANATLSGTATAPIVTVAGHEQMTASAGVNVYEITFYADNATKRLSTANFILFVEPAALDASTITSESLMLELNDLIAAVPNAVAAADRAEAAVQSVEGVTTQVATNTQDISDIKADLSEIEPGLSETAKQALLTCFSHVALWDDGQGNTYIENLRSALYEEKYPYLTVSFNPGTEIIYDDYDVEDLRRMLTVKYYTAKDESQTITNYTLSGSLTSETSNIVLTYEGLSKIISVNVVVGRQLTIDDILSSVGFSGLTVNNGNIDWTSVQTFSAVVFKNNIKHIRLTRKDLNARDEVITPRVTWTVFGTYNEGVYAVDSTSGYVFASDGEKYNATKTEGLTTITNTLTGTPSIDARIDVKLVDGVMEVRYEGDQYNGVMSLTNATIIGIWGNGTSTKMKALNVRVYDE